MKIITDTATLIIYDPSLLKHRLDDNYDWWSDPLEELAEVNQGNILFVGLTEDGAYELEVMNGTSSPLAADQSQTDSPVKTSHVQALLKNSSGRFYIGPGEAVTSEGEAPEESVAGHFVDVEPGNYEVTISSNGNQIKIWFRATDQGAVNKFDESLVLYDDDSDYFEFIYYEDIGEIIDFICNHLEDLGYEWEESEAEEEIVYYHEAYGYLMIEEYEGGVRLYTAVEYDPVNDLEKEALLEWRMKLLMVLDHFNASSTVARAYDDSEDNQIIIDVWYPGAYTKQAFEVFLSHWHEDITIQLEEAENDIFGDHKLH